MWHASAEQARREIAALAGRHLGVAEVHRRATDVVARAVPADLACWAVLDPRTLLINAMTGGAGLPADYGPLLADAEFSPTEPNTFAALARRGSDVALLTDLPQRDRRRSARLHTVWRPLGLDQEARVVFAADGVCWGAAGMVRTGVPFTARETEYLAAVAPVVARVTRDALRDELAARADGGVPSVVLLDATDRIRSMTPGAERWREAVEDSSPGWFQAVMRMVGAGTRGAAGGTLAVRVRDGAGGWTLVSGSLLGGVDAGGCAVTITTVTADDLTALLLEAYGLTWRERDVCREVIAGRSTGEIADRLFLSPYTVQDHLKSAFDKVGVRSRGGLVARLRPEATTAARAQPVG